MQPSKFSFELDPTDPAAALRFEVWLNDCCVFETDHVAEYTVVVGELPRDSIPAPHSLKFVLKNKQPEHTQISDTGEIIKDACLTISQLKFDDIELNFNIMQTAVYCHNFNNTAESSDHKFFGTLGCNGIVELKFLTPIYPWLLAHSQR